MWLQLTKMFVPTFKLWEHLQEFDIVNTLLAKLTDLASKQVNKKNSNLKVYCSLVCYNSLLNNFALGNLKLFLTNQSFLIVSLSLTASSYGSLYFLNLLMHPIYSGLLRRTLDGEPIHSSSWLHKLTSWRGYLATF